MTDNPHRRSTSDNKVGRLSTSNSTDDLDVFYSDTQRFTAPLRFKAFSDRGKLKISSEGNTEFVGNKVKLKTLDVGSMRLLRPPFAYPQFIFIVGVLAAYVGYYVVPSRDIPRIWIMSITVCIIALLMLRFLTVSWLEITEQQMDRSVKHYFFCAKANGWSGILGGNAKLLENIRR